MDPDKVKNFMRQHEPKERRASYQSVLKDNAALAEEACGVDCLAALGLAREQLAAVSCQLRQELQMNRAAVNIGQPGKITTQPHIRRPALNERRTRRRLRKRFATCRASAGQEQGEQEMASERPLFRAD
jgi:hypothetical protein